ncbi:DUF2971 domain-containing protein [uncultured Sphingomonas sp.]|uniref:DUF2971 domain-containing protein n=1 Tax=uncultured Sphingomonas sp. TaxID=158754 RepID=UPI0035CA3ECE
MALRLVTHCSSGFADMFFSSETGEVHYLGPEDPKWVSLEGLSYPTIAKPFAPSTYNDCFFSFPRGDIVDGTPPGPGLIYHYTSLDTAKLILESKKLRLSRFANANDEYERSELWFGVYCSENDRSPDVAINVSRELTDRLRTHWCFASFSTDGGGWSQAAAPEIYDSAGWKHPSMWAHYSQRHKKTSDGASRFPGAVLVFERKKLIASALEAYNERTMIYGNIRYVDEGDSELADSFFVNHEDYLKLGADELSGHLLMQFWRSYYLTKFKGWSYESEARLLINLPHDETCFIPIDTALVEVMIGDGATEDELEKAGALADAVGASTGIVRWRNGLPIRVPFER